MGFMTIFTVLRTFGGGAANFVLKHWKPLLVIGILAGLYFYRLHLLNTIGDLEDQLQLAQSNLVTCQANQVKLQSGIDRQNDEIERWAEIGREQGEKLAELEGKLTERQKVIDTRVREVLTGKKPENCDDAIKYLIQSAPELSWPKKQ